MYAYCKHVSKHLTSYTFNTPDESTNAHNHFVCSCVLEAKCWLQTTKTMCDRAYENRPCERKLHRVIFLLISFVSNTLSHFRKLHKNAN